MVFNTKVTSGSDGGAPGARRTKRALYEFSPFECLPIYAYFCVDICHVIAVCWLLMILRTYW